ncbi:sulfatase family protein [Paraburkholderia antibiotica]|nr:sulfatase-like hydrolase/transferase [Paraburkholderia antibiotica]
MTDQQRADHLGADGNPIVRTPNLDQLASGGWRADRMYVATPVCMPNRASILTGRYPSAHGARHNGIALSTDATTFVDMLRVTGYSTALVGKAHFQNMTNLPPSWPVRAEDRLVREAFRAPAGRYDQELKEKWLADDAFELDYPFYGFETVDLVDDHSDEVHGHYLRWLRSNHPQVAQLAGRQQAVPTPEYELSRFGQAWRTRVPEELYPTAYIADRACAKLRAFSSSDRPFFLQVSFPDPHHPFTPPGRYWNMYMPDDVSLPASFHHPEPMPPHLRWLLDRRANGKDAKHTPALFACSEREAREAIALNYGSITNIDDRVGQIMDTLEDAKLLDNTVVIFTSDHGDYLGDHRLMLKGPIHYQGLIRVPFIWKDPAGVAGARSSDALFSSIDIAPTILDRAGVTRFNGMQGECMLPVMLGRKESVRENLLLEEENQRVILGFQGRTRCRTLMNRRYRLTIYDGVQWGELYDLQEDPLEFRNCWDDSAYAGTRAAMMESLTRSMLYHVDTSPYPSALA